MITFILGLICGFLICKFLFPSDEILINRNKGLRDRGDAYKVERDLAEQTAQSMSDELKEVRERLFFSESEVRYWRGQVKELTDAFTQEQNYKIEEEERERILLGREK